MDLPFEIILIILTNLALDDLFSFQQTSRICSSIALRTEIGLSRILEGNYSYLYRHMLLAGTAEQIGSWAVETLENQKKLRIAILDGVEGLLGLSVKLAFVRLEDLQHLYQINRNLLHPISRRLVDESPGQLDVPGAQLALWNYLIYCKLFRHSYEEGMSNQGPTLSVETKKLFLAHCVPFVVLAVRSPGKDLWSVVTSNLFRSQNVMILGSIIECCRKRSDPLFRSQSQLRVYYVIQSLGEDFLKALQSGKNSYDTLVNRMLDQTPTTIDATEERTWKKDWRLASGVIGNITTRIARATEDLTGRYSTSAAEDLV